MIRMDMLGPTQFWYRDRMLYDRHVDREQNW